MEGRAVAGGGAPWEREEAPWGCSVGKKGKRQGGCYSAACEGKERACHGCQWISVRGKGGGGRGSEATGSAKIGSGAPRMDSEDFFTSI
jgi:hypothetical protein